MQSSQHVSINRSDHSDSCSVNPLISELQVAIAQTLRPGLQQIDVQGEYPETFMRQIGFLGGFKQGTPVELGGSGQGIKTTIQIIEEISKECLSTGFLVWCQTVCAWYIQNGKNTYLKELVLPGIITGKILAGTGLSNPLKHFAGIEKIHMIARPCSDGYILNGTLPWVSNIGKNHYLAIVARVISDDSYLMAVLPVNQPGLTLGNGGGFIALEGSSTCSCKFNNVFLPTHAILAHPCNDYLNKIKPGFILTQTGLGLGLVSSCIELMKRTNETKKHVNCFLNDQVEDITIAFHTVREHIYALADEIGCGQQSSRSENIKEIIQARILISELSLRASQAAMLHAGASGYRLHSAFEKKLRESYFVAIVTPALKHLRMMLSESGDLNG